MAAKACVSLKGLERVKCIIDSIVEVAKKNHGLREEYIDGVKVWGDFADIFVIGAPRVRMIVDHDTGEVKSSIAYSFTEELSEEHKRVLKKALEIAKREKKLKDNDIIMFEVKPGKACHRAVFYLRRCKALVVVICELYDYAYELFEVDNACSDTPPKPP